MDFTTLSKDDILAFAKIEPEYEEFAKSFPSGMINYADTDNVVPLLRHLTSLAQIPPAEPDVHEETLKIPARDGYELETLVFRPRGLQEATAPLVVLYYGGAYIFGFPAMMARTARLIVRRLGAVVVAPSYRHAPEHPFPCALNDTWDALRWLGENGGSLKADPSKGFVVGGSDVGGTLATVLAHLARDKALTPKLTGLYISGATFPLTPTPGLEDKYTDRILSPDQPEITEDKLENVALMKLGDDMYNADPNSEQYNPLLWPTGHRDLPRTYFQVCGRDAGRDPALVLDNKFKRDGVATKVDMYPGLPHCFWYPLKQHSKTRQWEEDTINGFA